MVNFGYVRRLKGVLIMGEIAANGESYTANGSGWQATFGNSASPCTNTSFDNTSGGSLGGKEIMLETSAQYLAICKSIGTLSLSLVVLIPYPCELDCSALSLAAQVYYINESNPLNLPACVGPKTTTVTGTLR